MADPTRLPYGIPTPSRTKRLIIIDFRPNPTSGMIKVKESTMVLSLIDEQTNTTDALLLRLTFPPYAPCYTRHRL